MAVGAARVRPYSSQSEMKTLATGVPLNSDGTALGGAITQHQLTVIIEPHFRKQAQVGWHFYKRKETIGSYISLC